MELYKKNVGAERNFQLRIPDLNFATSYWTLNSIMLVRILSACIQPYSDNDMQSLGVVVDSSQKCTNKLCFCDQMIRKVSR